MFVQTQSTPNPASLMFIPGEAVLPPGAGGVTFSSARDARAGSPSSPLASAIFRVEGVVDALPPNARPLDEERRNAFS